MELFQSLCSFIYRSISLKIALIAPKMCGYITVSRIFYIMFSFGINMKNAIQFNENLKTLIIIYNANQQRR